MTNNITKHQNIPILRFPGFSDPWTEKKLGTLSDVRDGTHDSPKYHNKGYPLITSRNLKTDGSIDFDNVNLIALEDFMKINKRSKVDIGDILFGMIGTIGNPVLIRHDNFAIKNVALIKEKQDLINKYLFQYLKSSYIDKKFYQKNAGGTQKFIALGLIRDLGIPTPSLPEQQKIADFLSSIDSWLDNLRAQKSFLESYKKSIMQKIFSQKIRFKDENGKDYPEWEEKKIDQLGDVIGGGTPDTSMSSNWNGDIDWFTPTEIKDKYIYDSKRKITKTGLKTSSARILPPGSLLLTSRATIGYVSISRKESTTNQGFQSIVVNSYNSNEFLYYWITANRNMLLRKANGSTFLEISGKDVRKTIVNTPCLPEQHRIADFLTSIDKSIDFKQKQIAEAELWKKGLMQRMLV
ncbi:MAG: hypothetical protein DPW11_00200 [bacterium]|nr:restriction endonuclease subunit S [Candidatus Microgenomates bacterium CPR3]MCQ3944191.1 hypothetical protein [bacterium]RIK51970.1 MAG: hypothetical protein DCC61_01105 [Candidatus Microgenomates bacterium]